MDRLRVELHASPTPTSGDVKVGWFAKSHPEGLLVPWHEAKTVEAERDAALARVRELEALTAEQRVVIAGWTETAAAQQARIAELDGEARYGSCFTVAERFKKEQGDTSLFTADWLESRLKKLAELEASKPLRELSAIKQAAFPHGFMGSAEELPAWMDRKLTDLGGVRDRLADAMRAHDSRTATLHKVIDASSGLGRPSHESVVAWMKNLAATRDALIAERDYLQKMAGSWGWTDEKPLSNWLNARLRERFAAVARLETLRKAFNEDEPEGFEETSTPY